MDTEQERKKWTVMIYLAGDNSLSPMSIAIMQQLESVLTDRFEPSGAGAAPNVRVLAGFDANTPAQRGTRYLDLNYQRRNVTNGMNWGLHNDLIPPEERQEPTLRVGLERFLKYATSSLKEPDGTRRVADHYILILFGHGTAVAGKTFLIDEHPPGFLRLPELQAILGKYFGFGDESETKKKLDLLAFHNCAMNGVETAYQLKNEVNYTLGSQDLVLQVGWPYRALIEGIIQQTEAGAQAAQIARGMLVRCARHQLDYTLMDRSSDQAVCDLQMLDGLIQALKGDLVPALRAGLGLHKQSHTLLYPLVREAVQLARLEAQSYWDETFVDLGDFCGLLQEKCQEFRALLDKEASDAGAADKLDKLAEACAKVQSQVGAAIEESYYIGPALQYSQGLSIYFPWNKPLDTFFDTSVAPPEMRESYQEYLDYRFAKDTGWGEFLNDYFAATLRPVRRTPPMQSGAARLSVNALSRPMALAINLSKSHPDSSRESAECLCPSIKNYPRRNYLAPADAAQVGGAVNYLGWNALGVVREVITDGAADGPMIPPPPDA